MLVRKNMRSWSSIEGGIREDVKSDSQSGLSIVGLWPKEKAGEANSNRALDACLEERIATQQIQC